MNDELEERTKNSLHSESIMDKAHNDDYETHHNIHIPIVITFQNITVVSGRPSHSISSTHIDPRVEDHSNDTLCFSIIHCLNEHRLSMDVANIEI